MHCSYEENPKSIKYHVRRYLQERAVRLKGKRIIDVPAGNGFTTRNLLDIGAIPVPYDLFPEYFKLENISCQQADIRDGLPENDESSHMVICQEGIEHFSDQIQPFREFNRILKPGGTLLITTPNYSNLKARLSYYLGESENLPVIMPPNELDSIWMSDGENLNAIYYGHIFLLGIQKLRVLARLSGFEIKNIIPTRAKTSAKLLLILSYPWIWLFNVLTYRKKIKKTPPELREQARKIYREQLRLNLNSSILTDGHLMIEFQKTASLDEVAAGLNNLHQEFGLT